ncbi:hypothetical protein KIPB_002048, partial [Kipferlia bialata]
DETTHQSSQDCPIGDTDKDTENEDKGTDKPPPPTPLALTGPSLALRSVVQTLRTQVTEPALAIVRSLDRILDIGIETEGSEGFAQYTAGLRELDVMSLVPMVLRKYGFSTEVCRHCALLTQTLAEEAEGDTKLVAMYETGICDLLAFCMHQHGYNPEVSGPILSAIGTIAYPDANLASMLKTPPSGQEPIYKYAVTALETTPDEYFVVKSVSYLLSLLLNADSEAAVPDLYLPPLVHLIGHCAEAVVDTEEAVDLSCHLFDCLTQYSVKAFSSCYEVGAHFTAIHTLKAYPECEVRCQKATFLLCTLLAQAAEEGKEEEAVGVMVRAGAVPDVLAVLEGHADNAEVLDPCFDALTALMLDDGVTAKALYEAGTHTKALRVAATFPANPGLVTSVCRHLSRIANDNEDRSTALMHMGAIKTALSVMDRHGDNDEAVLFGLVLINGIKDKAPEDEFKAHLIEIGGHEAAIRVLKMYMTPDTEEGVAAVSEAAGILWNLTYDDKTFRPDIFNLDNVGLLVPFLGTCKDDERVVLSVLGTLANMCHCDTLRDVLFEMGVHKMAHEGLKAFPETENSPVIAESMCEIIMQFAGAGMSNVKTLIADGCTEWVVGALKQYGTDPEQSDLVLVGLGALGYMAEEDSHVKTMIEMGVLDTVESVCAAHADNQEVHGVGIKVRETLEGKVR